MLAGRLPFESESPIELARMHVQERPFPLADARPTAPPALVALAEGSLAKDPEARPPDGEALARALSAGEQPTTLSDAPTRVIPRGGPGGHGRRRVPLPVLLAALLLFVAGAAGGAPPLPVRRPPASTPAPPPPPNNATAASAPTPP